MHFFYSFLFLLLTLVSTATRAHETVGVSDGKSVYTVATRTNDIGNIILFDELGKRLNISFRYMYFDQFSDVIKAVIEEKADFTGNVTYSKERSEYLDISPPTNIEYTYLFTTYDFSHRNSLDHVKTIAVAQNLIFKDLIANLYPNINIVEYSSYEHAKEMIRTQEVDGVVDNISKLELFLNDGFDAEVLNGKIPIQPVGLAAAKQHHTELMQEMVKYIHTPEMQKALREKMDQYQFDVRKQALRKRLALRGIDATQPLTIKLEKIIQFSEYDKGGRTYGIAPDILKQSCAILGLVCNITSKPEETWGSMYQELKNKELDILGPVSISTKRMKDMYFSQPYYSPEAIVVKRVGYKNAVYKTISEMVVERISVIKGDYYDQLLTSMLPRQKLYRMTSREEQIQALIDNKVDYVVLNRQNYNQMLLDGTADFSTTEDSTVGVFHKSQLAFGFPKTDKGYVLAQLFSAAQQLVDIETIVDKYDIKPNWRSIIEREKKDNRLIWSIFVISSLMMLLAVLFMYRQATTDNLTKLKNRRALYQKYSRGIPNYKTLVYIDVNKFKSINDNYGHRAGDLVLKHLSERISSHWPGTAYRLGGDEFVLIAHINKAKLDGIIEKLQSFTAALDKNKTITVTTSCGISTQRSNVIDIDEALHMADEQMYIAKNNSHELNGV